MKHAKRITAVALALFILITQLTFVALAVPAPAFSSGWTEDFDDISTLSQDGWAIINHSAIVRASWFQGVGGMFSAFQGVASSYIGVNYSSTSGSNTINTWLITPETTLSNGSTLTFYTRADDQSIYPDRLQIRMSTNGSSTDVGTGAEGIGDFTTLLLDINPALATNVYPSSDWTAYTVTISGLAVPVSGRLAFRYYVTNGGPSGVNSDYIGIDSVSYAPRLEILAAASPAAGGTVSGADTYDYNSTAVLTASPNPGYRFDNWTDAAGTIVSTDMEYNYLVVNSASLTAHFSLRTGPVNMSISPEAVVTAGGAWSIDGGTTWLDPGSHDILPGMYTITFRDIPGWTTPDSLAVITVIADSPLDLSGSYTRNTYTVTLPDDTGYTITPESGSASPVYYGTDYKFRIALDEAYSKSTVSVTGNGQPLIPAGGIYTLSNIQANQTVNVSGVTRNSYNVSFYWFAGDTGPVLDSQSVLHGDSAAASPTVPERTGLAFTGWDTSFMNIVSDLAVNALWSLQGVAISPYADTFDGMSHPIVSVSGTSAGDVISYDTGSGYTTVVPTATDAGKYPVTVKIERSGAIDWISNISEASILPATASVTINTDLTKVYDGIPVAGPNTTKTGDGSLAFLWFLDNNGSAGSALTAAPEDPGTYWVQAVSQATRNYTSAMDSKKFIISVSPTPTTAPTTTPTITPTTAPTTAPTSAPTSVPTTAPTSPLSVVQPTAPTTVETSAATSAATSGTAGTSAATTAAATTAATTEATQTTTAVTSETTVVIADETTAGVASEPTTSSPHNVAGAYNSGNGEAGTSNPSMWLILLAAAGGIGLIIALCLLIVRRTKKHS